MTGVFPSLTSLVITTGIGTLSPDDFIAFLASVFSTFPSIRELGSLDMVDRVWDQLEFRTQESTTTETDNAESTGTTIAKAPLQFSYPTLRKLHVNAAAWDFRERASTAQPTDSPRMGAVGLRILFRIFPCVTHLVLKFHRWTSVTEYALIMEGSSTFANVLAGTSVRRVTFEGVSVGKNIAPERVEIAGVMQNFVEGVQHNCKALGIRVDVHEDGVDQ
ncbi:hypothetical protein HDU93_001849 [Gonapodya sp. JEL0774]|nr:hypothetical protein HDU93_001849 [Gonapodya sp. JEL0774]